MKTIYLVMLSQRRVKDNRVIDKAIISGFECIEDAKKDLERIISDCEKYMGELIVKRNETDDFGENVYATFETENIKYCHYIKPLNVVTKKGMDE
jgi:hypothetical protein